MKPNNISQTTNKPLCRYRQQTAKKPAKTTNPTLKQYEKEAIKLERMPDQGSEEDNDSQDNCNSDQEWLIICAFECLIFCILL